MSEEILFESETRQSRGETADHLRRFVDSFEEGGAVTPKAGRESSHSACLRVR